MASSVVACNMTGVASLHRDGGWPTASVVEGALAVWGWAPPSRTTVTFASMRTTADGLNIRQIAPRQVNNYYCDEARQMNGPGTQSRESCHVLGELGKRQGQASLQRGTERNMQIRIPQGPSLHSKGYSMAASRGCSWRNLAPTNS